MEPELNGSELEPGDHIGNAVPVCHDGDMDNRGSDKHGHRTHKCDHCGTTVEVDTDGLVYDVR